MWFRVDNRLVHGQVIESWLPYTRARHLVVANDELAKDDLRQQIISLAVPQYVQIHFVCLSALRETLQRCGEHCLVLFATCQDARRAYDDGVVISVLNMGNLHHGPKKIQLLPHIALSAQDREDLRNMRQQFVQLDFRCVPDDVMRGSYEQLL